MRARHCPPQQPDHDDPAGPWLGDVVDMQGEPMVFRRVNPGEHHWAKRAAFIVAGVLLVWYGIVVWAVLL